MIDRPIIDRLHCTNKKYNGLLGHLVTVEDGELLAGEAMEAGSPFNHGLSNGQRVLDAICLAQKVLGPYILHFDLRHNQIILDTVCPGSGDLT